MPAHTDVLVKIQRLDLEIDALDVAWKKKDDESAALKVEVSEVERNIEGLTEQSETLATEKGELEEKIRVNKERISRDTERLNDIKNDKQLKAVNKELKSAESANRLHEMELSALTEKIDALVAESTEASETLNAKTENVESLTKELETLKVDNEVALKEKKTERATLSEDVPSALLKKYDTIRDRRAGVGLVPVVDEACQGCFIHIQPQLYILLRQGTDEIINCPHCHRILYFDNSEE